MPSKYEGLKTDSVQDKGLSIDLDKVTSTDISLIDLNINGVALKAPKRHIGNETSIAGKINDKGVITFSRCKESNKGNYGTLETPSGTVTFGERFRESLKARVK